MRTSWKILAPALIAATVPWLAGSAGAAPLSSSLSLKNADAAAVETVQWRRGHRGRWIGPAAGFAAGVAIGSAFAPRYYDYGYYGNPGYGAYAYDPGYVYAPAPRYRRDYGGYRGCTGDENVDSAYPSWACR
jgi:hypothetical protein